MKDVILGMDKIIDEPNPFPYDQFYDTRPLTDKALEDLGFEYIKDELMWNLDIIDNPFFNVVPDTKNGGYLFLHDDVVRLKTVGSVKMLIEALKGDE